MAYKKSVKKYVKKAGKMVYSAVKRRYQTKAGGVRVNQIVKDVAYLKSVLNPEKKKFQFNVTDATCAQCSVNNNGYAIYDITPNPAQGTTSITRNGNSIRVHSAHIRYQFQAMSATNGSPIRFKIMVIKTLGQPRTLADAVTTCFDINPFVTGGNIIDYFSDRNEEAFKQFQVLRTKYVTLKPNNHSGQKQTVTGSMGLKFKNHHIKFFADGSQTVQDGQYWLVALADNGNNSDGAPSTLVGTSETAISTGSRLQLDITQWFYDN